ncbi:MAG: hypothetical protein ACREIF_19460 [Chthoniobacterales bacterium]
MTESKPEKNRARRITTWLLTILVLFGLHLVLEHIFTPQNLKLADDYFHRQVNDAGAFHVSGIFFGHLVTFYTPPPMTLTTNPQPKQSDTPFLEALVRSWIYTVKKIGHEGVVSMITGLLALILGFVVMLHPRVIHPYTTLLLAPILGSILVYLLLGVMELAGWLLGNGAQMLAYFITPFPVLKECWSIIFEERQHHFVEGLIERLTRKA